MGSNKPRDLFADEDADEGADEAAGTDVSNVDEVAASIVVEVSALTTDPVTALPIVLLVDPRSGTTVPVSIGLAEASALAAEIDGIELARPATHQLMAAMLETCGARVLRAVITGMEGNLFAAVVHLELGCGSVAVQEARPSDALALALHTGAAVEISTRVVDQVARLGLASGLETGFIDCLAKGSREPLADPPASYEEDGLALFADDAFGKWKM